MTGQQASGPCRHCIWSGVWCVCSAARDQQRGGIPVDAPVQRTAVKYRKPILECSHSRTLSIVVARRSLQVLYSVRRFLYQKNARVSPCGVATPPRFQLNNLPRSMLVARTRCSIYKKPAHRYCLFSDARVNTLRTAGTPMRTRRTHPRP